MQYEDEFQRLGMRVAAGAFLFLGLPLMMLLGFVVLTQWGVLVWPRCRCRRCCSGPTLFLERFCWSSTWWASS